MANEPLQFEFSYSDIESYYQQYLNNEGQVINQKTFYWPHKTLEFFWACTKGTINEENLIAYRQRALSDASYTAQAKWFRYAHSFLKQLERKYSCNLNYFIEDVLSKRYITGKTTRPAPIVLDDDITRTINHILNHQEHRKGIKKSKEDYLIALLFLCYTGIRPDTPERIPLKQIKTALESNPPILAVNEDITQEKINKVHYIPLHPDLVEHLNMYISSRRFTNENQPIIKKTKLYSFFRSHPIELVSKIGKRFTTNLPRKYFIQKSKALKLDQNVLNHIVGHGEINIEEHNYLGESLRLIVYKEYLEKWGHVHLIPKKEPIITIPNYNEFKQLSNEERKSFLKSLKYHDVARLPPEEQYWIENELEVLELQQQAEKYDQENDYFLHCYDLQDEKYQKFKEKYC